MFATGVVFFPLLGALIAGLFGRLIGDRGAQLVTCGGLILAALCSWVVLPGVVGGAPYKVEVLRWIHSGTFEADWVLRVDVLSAVMMFVVSTVSALIHVYSIGYMAHDPGIPRFMSYLSLFTFFMLALVTADNFLQLYFGWEGVGLVSYLLIGFWYTRPSACAAAIKAFLVNRVGDFGFALGIAAIYLVFDSIEFDVVFAGAAQFVDTEIAFLGMSRRHAHADLHPLVHRRDGQVRPARPAHLAARRDGGPDPGLGADPRRDHGDRGRVPGRALLAACSSSRPQRSASSPSSAPAPRSSPRPSASCRTTSSG